MAALCVLLAAACAYDYRENRIPNGIIVLAVFWGVGWQSWDGGIWGALCYLGQAAAVMALLFPFFRIGGLGAGDVKLLGVTAGYLPFGKILAFLFCSLLVAAMVSGMKMWKEHSFRERAGYLSAYLGDVMRGGAWKPYQGAGAARHSAGIRLSGPIFLGVLLYLGGVY